MTTHNFTSPDISCDHCKQTIEKEGGAKPGIEFIEVNPAEKSIEVELDESILSVEDFKAFIEDIGYDLQ